MEAWGIIMTAFTLFGMVALMIASVTTDNGTASRMTQITEEPKKAAAEFKKAA